MLRDELVEELEKGDFVLVNKNHEELLKECKKLIGAMNKFNKKAMKAAMP